MISSNSKKRSLSSESVKSSYVQQLYSGISQINLELGITLCVKGTFLALLIFSDDVLLQEFSKAMLIITSLSLFQFLKPNSNNSKQ